MDFTRRLQFAVFVLFFITIDIEPIHTKLFGARPKREHGQNLYLPALYVIPDGEGSPAGWSEWSAPSECSRTCGGGVSSQTRTCLNLDSYGSPTCSGGSTKYFSCNTQDCPDKDLDFRRQQCSEFDSTPFEGLRYEWVPYLKAPNPCELNCMPRGERFYFRHKSSVIDGTRCNDESNDVCVDGKCQPVGCDLMLGSSAREDKCRTCSGDGSSCKTVEGTLTTDDLQHGYNDILLIPAGATNIVIKEKAPSNNYLAIRNASNHYYLNGNWRIDFPRPIAFAGTIWHYDRRPQGFAAPDHITAFGPTTEIVYLVLLSQDRNVGVHYEYSVRDTAIRLPELDSYDWTFAPYGTCNATCGGGIQTRKITCNSRNTLKQVDDGLCSTENRPTEQQKCAQESCPPKWSEGEWSKCSAPCGGGSGTQTREVKCVEITSTGDAKPLKDDDCLQKAGNKPATEKSCEGGKDCARWHIGRWNACSKLSGEGTQSRIVKCYKLADGHKKVLPESDCADQKPEISQKCILRPSEGVDWVSSQWNGCEKCGQTQETRTAYCVGKSGKVYNETFCQNHHKPELNRTCTQVVECGFQWFSSQWSQCSADCGNGVQSRNIVCAKKTDKGIELAGDESACVAADKPENARECDSGKKCEGQWFTGPWGACSKKCGGGEQSRKVLCIASGQQASAKLCGEDAIAFSTTECNKQPCIDDAIIPVDTTSKPIEEDDEGEEYCDEDEDMELIEISTIDEFDVSTVASSSEPTSAESESSEATSLEPSSTEPGKLDATESTIDAEEMMSDATIATDITSDGVTDLLPTTYEGSGDTEGSGETESSSIALSPRLMAEAETESASEKADTTTQASMETSSDASSAASMETTQSATETEAASSTTEQNESTTDSASESTTDSSPTTEVSPSTESSSDETSTTADQDTTTEQFTTAAVTDAETAANTEANTATSPAQTTESDASTTTAQSGQTESTSAEMSTESSVVAEQSTTETSTSESLDLSSMSSESSSTEQEQSTDVSSSTEAVSSTSPSDIESTTDIWSSTSSVEFSTTDEDIWSTTPNALDAIITKEQKPRQCKLRKAKPSACLASEFGCCPDNKTASTGPFDEGCALPETCKETKYGCCEDGVSPAKGKKYKGCPEPLCTSSLFGCCSDGKTEAEGENNEGCPIITTTTTTTTPKPTKKQKAAAGKTTTTTAKPGKCAGADCSPCDNEPFGCCSDKKTPAHGQNGEGCCLSSPYGCCPDNITPARGPNLEDCSCEYSPYGCCPDNKTAARGHENAGCGCEHEKYGCCPDKITPAAGPKFEGCACHTYQFGCCPDGVTIQKGPHRQGCHCAHTQFKCCSDGVTAAKGENFEGCTCANSRFGCCSDGVTESQGSNFEGCETVPSVPQKACSLNKDTGNCSNYAIKYFFDMEYGGCSRFWYSGCGGNDNRFESIEDCKGTCEKATGRDACLLPKIHGPCTAHFQRYYYDSDRNQCSAFAYGGCLGNTNNFKTVEECQSQCVIDTSLSPCEQPVENGPCNGNFERWFFDKQDDTCKPFRYGGCKGNKNNFVSEQSCKYECKNPSQQKAKCVLPKETGKCEENKARWYFSPSDNKCMPFYFTGCDGNKNNYVSIEDCEGQCPRNITKDICYKAAETGDCQNYEARWYYDTKEEQCRQFYYGGCGGNENNFRTENECLHRCEKPTTPAPAAAPAPVPQPPVETAPRVGVEEPFRQEDCLLGADVGPCRAMEHRYYYNSQDGLCDVFGYGGCEGNNNNFQSFDECDSKCGAVQDPCSLPAIYGRCQENITRFHYDSQRGECLPFEYSGCRGNKNNFYSIRDCQAQCQRQQPQVQPQHPSRDELCRAQIEECNSLSCPYGVSRSYDGNECERCECENPCRDYQCPDDSRCAVDIRSDDQYSQPFVPVCRHINKPGACPAISNDTHCATECYDDADCRGDNKCCVAGCSRVCVDPIDDREPPHVYVPPTQSVAVQRHEPMPATLDEKAEGELDIIQPEGGVATLKCYATGYPLPTITWKKGSIVINTNQGRFELTSSGDLQIVQVHKSDSGTYVCVADNGLGAPLEREVKLEIADPVDTAAYILGETNSSKIVEFNQPAVIRCLAGGFPKPIVNWWRGKNMLPLKSTRFEVNREFSLVFESIGLSDLGPYVCQAYSGVGKPVSMYVTLNAIGPAYPTSEEDEQYLRYVLDAPPIPQQNIPISYIPTPAVDLTPLEPVSVNVILPRNSKSFTSGNDLNIQCETSGYPKPEVKWTRNGFELYPSDRIRISDANTLTIYGVNTEDSGLYRCSAWNQFTRTFHEEPITIESFVSPQCSDNQFYANCELIVKFKLCNNEHYKNFCCRSCTLAGQLPMPFESNFL